MGDFILRDAAFAAPQDEVIRLDVKLIPHGEEPRSGVSNHEATNA
jgi:hypothetical protein